jgi:hypothetical protein
MDCSVDGCVGPAYCKGFCAKHNNRWRKHGDPLHVGKPGPPAHTCDIPECGKPCVSNGLCDMHRKRLERWGDSLITHRVLGDDEARWWSHVSRGGDDECWPWDAYCDENGYGIFWDGRKIIKAHRWGYERYVGPIPGGLVPDHTCHDPDVCEAAASECPHRRCVNYRHLEPVTNRENVLRGASTRLSDESATELLARWRSGTGINTLAAETGLDKSALHRRLVRAENASASG